MLARRDTRREASRLRRLSPLQTLEDQSRTWGIRCHSCTGREGLPPSWKLSYKTYVLRFTRESRFSFNQRIARIPMSCHPRVTEWTTIIQTHLPHLSKPQATVLALWSLGMVLARSCALTAVSAFLATWLGRKEPAVRQQLRELCYEASAKRGTTR